METKTLIRILRTRINACDGNPTERHFLVELLGALHRLEDFEKASQCQVNREKT